MVAAKATPKAKETTKKAPAKTTATKTAAKPAATKATAKAPAKTTAAKAAPKTEAKKEPVKKAAPKRQFVSPHPDGGWQVKIEGSTKATKRFDTKAEAEVFAKALAANQGTSVMRQKKDGKLQKKH